MNDGLDDIVKLFCLHPGRAKARNFNIHTDENHNNSDYEE